MWLTRSRPCRLHKGEREKEDKDPQNENDTWMSISVPKTACRTSPIHMEIKLAQTPTRRWNRESFGRMRTSWWPLIPWLMISSALINSKLVSGNHKQVVPYHYAQSEIIAQWNVSASLTWLGCRGLHFWHKPTELVHSFYSVLVSISAFMDLLTVFYSINSTDNSPLSHSVLPALFLPYWSFQLHISLWKSPSTLIQLILCGWLGLKHQPTN